MMEAHRENENVVNVYFRSVPEMHYGMGLNVCINNTNIIERLWVHETWALTSLHEWIIQKNDLQHT